MKLWLVGLGLALLCTVNADSECSGDFSQLQGKWFATAVGSTCEHFLKHKDKAKIVVTEMTTTEENKLRIMSTFRGKDGCKKVEMEFEEMDDGSYYHKSDWGEKKMKLVATDCATYALVDVETHKKGKNSVLVAMYTKEPRLTDELKEMFLEHGRSLRVRDNHMIFPTEVACQKEA